MRAYGSVLVVVAGLCVSCVGAAGSDTKSNGKTSATGGTGGTGTSGVGSTSTEVPQGLGVAPTSATCEQGESCNGFCVGASNPTTADCSLVGVGSDNRGIDVPGDGYVYVAHGDGIYKMNPTNLADQQEVVTSGSPSMITNVAVLGDHVYHDEDGLMRVPINGGSSEAVAGGEGAYFVEWIVRRGNTLYIPTINGLFTYSSNGQVDVVSEEAMGAFVGEDTLYWEEMGLMSAPLSDTSLVTEIASQADEHFVIVGSKLFSIDGVDSDLRNAFFDADVTGGSGTVLWTEGVGDYAGSLSRLKAFPGRNSVFFIFQTELNWHLMRWDTATTTMHRVVTMGVHCLNDYVVSNDEVYVSGCRGVYRIGL